MPFNQNRNFMQQMSQNNQSFRQFTQQNAQRQQAQVAATANRWRCEARQRTQQQQQQRLFRLQQDARARKPGAPSPGNAPGWWGPWAPLQPPTAGQPARPRGDAINHMHRQGGFAMTTTDDSEQQTRFVDLAGDSPAASLQLISGAGRGSSIPVPAPGLIIGRSGDAALRAGADKTVSRRHARVYRSADGQLRIDDLGSANGTFLNGQRLSESRPLRNEDVIRTGNIEFRVSEPPAGPPPAMSGTGGNGQPAADPAGLLLQGRRLLEQDQLDRSAQAFQRASDAPSAVGPAHYGLGMVALVRGDAAGAQAAFEQALRADPGDANARFQLGFLWEKQGLSAQAFDAYRQVLAAAPGHASARVRYEALRNSQGPVQAGGAGPGDPLAQDELDESLPADIGVLAYLLSEPTPISRQAIALIRKLEIDRRPRFAAHFGRHPVFAFVLVLYSVLIFAAARSAAGFLPLLLGLIVYGVMYLRVLCTRVRLRHGRLQVDRGVLRRDQRNFDLWRVRTVRLKKTLFNRMTGDGTLILALGPEGLYEHRRMRRGQKSIKIIGIAHGAELDSLYQGLLNLVFLLRGNPVVKGIVQ